MSADSVLARQIGAFTGALAAIAGNASDYQQRIDAELTLGDILRWLWGAVTEPVLRRLGFDGEPPAGRTWPRVWWIPGGMLSQLPLHAAGDHQEPGQAVLDRVVSSYAPTIRALTHARGRLGIVPPQRSLVVAMPTTPGASPLHNVAAEAASLKQKLPAPTILIETSDVSSDTTPTKEAVIGRLAEAHIAHFACHAASHPNDPSRSQLYLHDHEEDPFTVATLLPVRLSGPQLAYLSACQTSRNAATDLLDEAIHLASAFQLAGYPHVIGTLWEINDKIAADIAGGFYTHLRTPSGELKTASAAIALHETIRDIR